jgi:hypothetical protein
VLPVDALHDVCTGRSRNRSGFVGTVVGHDDHPELIRRPVERLQAADDIGQHVFLVMGWNDDVEA